MNDLQVFADCFCVTSGQNSRCFDRNIQYKTLEHEKEQWDVFNRLLLEEGAVVAAWDLAGACRAVCSRKFFFAEHQFGCVFVTFGTLCVEQAVIPQMTVEQLSSAKIIRSYYVLCSQAAH